MRYTYNVGVMRTFAQKYYKQVIIAVTGLFIATLASVGLSASAVVVNVNGCDFEDGVAGVWSLQSDCNVTSRIDIPAGTTVEGNGYTVFADYDNSVKDNSNNAAFGVVGADNVTINNLTIDGTDGVWLHGINTYLSENVNINDVVIKNMSNSGIVVNGSDVTVNNVVTENSGWHGINVAQGVGVVEPSVLTVAGPVDQSNDLADIYVDDKDDLYEVNDPLGQYTFYDDVAKVNDRVYIWSDVVAPAVEITAPVAGNVSGEVTVEGTISDFHNVRHRVLVRNSDGDVVYSEIVRDQSDLVNASIAFDSKMYPDGEYRLVLVGIDSEGNRGRDVVRVTFDNVVTDKDGCRNNGWTYVVQGFRNQGDCVSYFATANSAVGNNPAVGGASNDRANSNKKNR